MGRYAGFLSQDKRTKSQDCLFTEDDAGAGQSFLRQSAWSAGNNHVLIC